MCMTAANLCAWWKQFKWQNEYGLCRKKMFLKRYKYVWYIFIHASNQEEIIMRVDVDLFGPAQRPEGIRESKLRWRQFRKRSCRGKTALPNTDPCHLHKRLCWLHRNVREERCHLQGPVSHQGRLLGLASGYRGRPWRTELRGRIQTCTRTAHLRPVEERNKSWSKILNKTGSTYWMRHGISVWAKTILFIREECQRSSFVL